MREKRNDIFAALSKNDEEIEKHFNPEKDAEESVKDMFARNSSACIKHVIDELSENESEETEVNDSLFCLFFFISRSIYAINTGRYYALKLWTKSPKHVVFGLNCKFPFEIC